MRRPLRSISVLPVPIARRLIDATSPRAEFTPPETFSVLLNPTSPNCGIEQLLIIYNSHWQRAIDARAANLATNNDDALKTRLFIDLG